MRSHGLCPHGIICTFHKPIISGQWLERQVRMEGSEGAQQIKMTDSISKRENWEVPL